MPLSKVTAFGLQAPSFGLALSLQRYSCKHLAFSSSVGSVERKLQSTLISVALVSTKAVGSRNLYMIASLLVILRFTLISKAGYRLLENVFKFFALVCPTMYKYFE